MAVEKHQLMVSAGKLPWNRIGVFNKILIKINAICADKPSGVV